MHRLRPLAEQVVVVTGASSGIGRELARQLAERHARLVLAARREEPLDEVRRECERMGATALVVGTDVSDASEVEALADQAQRRFGRIDAWVNDAGVYVMGSLEETPLDAFRRVMDVNYFGVVYGTRAAVKRLRGQHSPGVIVNISSQLGSVSAAYVSAYTASKHAVRGFTSAVRQELLGSGIELCTVMPAAVDTPLFTHSANYTGYAVKPPDPVYSPERVAHAIVKLLEHPKPETYVGSSGPLFGGLRHLAPRAFDRLMRKQIERGHFLDEPQGRTPGNLYHPMPQGAAVHGGWKGPGRTWLRRLGLALAVGAGMYGIQRRLVGAGPRFGVRP